MENLQNSNKEIVSTYFKYEQPNIMNYIKACWGFGFVLNTLFWIYIYVMMKLEITIPYKIGNLMEIDIYFLGCFVFYFGIYRPLILNGYIPGYYRIHYNDFFKGFIILFSTLMYFSCFRIGFIYGLELLKKLNLNLNGLFFFDKSIYFNNLFKSGDFCFIIIVSFLFILFYMNYSKKEISISMINNLEKNSNITNESQNKEEITEKYKEEDFSDVVNLIKEKTSKKQSSPFQDYMDQKITKDEYIQKINSSKKIKEEEIKKQTETNNNYSDRRRSR